MYTARCESSSAPRSADACGQPGPRLPLRLRRRRADARACVRGVAGGTAAHADVRERPIAAVLRADGRANDVGRSPTGAAAYAASVRDAPAVGIRQRSSGGQRGVAGELWSEGGAPAGRSACVLLLHAAALLVGSASGPETRGAAGARAPGAHAAGGGTAALGLRGGATSGCVRGHDGLRGRQSPARLRPRVRGAAAAGGRSALPRPAGAGRRLLPGDRTVRSVQAL